MRLPRAASLQLRNATASAVFVLLSGAAADAACALDHAIAYHRNCSLAHDYVAAGLLPCHAQSG